MLIGRALLIIIIIFLTFTFAAITNELTNNNHQDLTESNEKPGLLVIPIQQQKSAADKSECQEACSIDYCLKYISITRSCKKLIRDQCDCCTVCLRTENEICGGHLNIYGICEQNFLCYKSKPNLSNQTGICVKACLKFQCLRVIRNNKSICECANRHVPCDGNLHNYNQTYHYCEQESILNKTRAISLLKANDGKVNSIILQ